MRHFLFITSFTSLVSLFAYAKTPVERYISSLDLEHAPTALYWSTIESNQVLQSDLNRWRTMPSGNTGRWDVFAKIFFANTRSRSNQGLHHSACFTGNAEDIIRDFLTPGHQADIAYIDPASLSASASSDGRIIGIDFTLKNDTQTQWLNYLRGRSWHFRLPNCLEGGKMPILNENMQLITSVDKMKSEERAPAADQAPDVPTTEQGFQIFDRLNQANASLPQFQLRSNYSQIRPKPTDRPWKDLDISTPAGAERFAIMMQEYFYNGMANQDPQNTNNNFIASQNSVRDWCHMPWLNVGEAGREAIHGLTKERDLYPSNIYPHTPRGSDWGIGFYNSYGCATIGRVFGSGSAPSTTPNFSQNNTRFPDGTVSAKILFTTASFPEVQNAFSWTANVSEPGSTVRQPRTVRHIQMDIAVKDSSLKGTLNNLGNWVMITYYYDANYNSTLNVPNLPEAFKHMRPQGVQFAFNPQGSIIFSGAQTNSNSGLLNGPADNPKSTCLGCHGTAGTRVSMSPGFRAENTFQSVANANLDFSQQMALAKRNFETRSRH